MQLLQIPALQDVWIILVIGILVWCLILSLLISDATNQKKHLANEAEIIRLLKSIDNKTNIEKHE